MRYHKQVAIASATVGTDLLQVTPVLKAAKEGFDRVLCRSCLTGSAVVGDFTYELFVGGVSFGVFANTRLGLAGNNDDMMPVMCRVPANAQVECKVTLAGATNPVSIALEFAP